MEPRAGYPFTRSLPRGTRGRGTGLAAARDAGPDRLALGLGELSIPASPEQLEALLELAKLLERWAQRINLTGHRTAERIVRHLILEAAALVPHLAGYPELRTLADLGSGSGFPGLPIALLRPEWRLTLVEARERRHHFQRAAVRELGIRNVRLTRGRAEDLEPVLHDAAVAQAMAQPERAIAWMLPWVRPGGLLVLPGSISQPDLYADLATSVGAEVQFDRRIQYRVPCGGPERRLWIGRRKPPGYPTGN